MFDLKENFYIYVFFTGGERTIDLTSSNLQPGSRQKITRQKGMKDYFIVHRPILEFH